VGQSDPNPLVAGKGIELIRQSGAEVISGIMEKEARELNAHFNTYHERKRPYIVLKWAESLNGMMHQAGSEKGIFWISHPETRKLVHYWRSKLASILVGYRTVMNDDPQLDVRHVSGKDPLRIIMAGDERIPEDRKILRDGKPTLVVSGFRQNYPAHIHQLETKDILAETLQHLHDTGINSVLVEGGAYTIRKFLEAGLWDEARVIRSDIYIPSGLASPVLGKPYDQKFRYGRDEIFIFRNG
jgi:diaminohydroxyphosphoribosylaminopyrimidine deaminase/5-amino-6-(5-phosphoribosylamino)uracil reductase